MIKWTESSFCDGGNCVQVSVDPLGTVYVRDSKDPTGPVLAFTYTEWEAFTAGVRNHEFEVA